MRLLLPLDLSYCLNVHPGQTWAEVKRQFFEHVIPIKKQVSPHKPFGLGLRLSYQACQDLQQAENFAELMGILQSHDLYVFTINGFIYGPFHGQRVKQEVYLPDWRDEERLEYSNLLADIAAQITSESQPISISTSPGAFKQNISNLHEVGLMAENFLRHAVNLWQIWQKTGKKIYLAIEPEPSCFLENSSECIHFFKNYLFAPATIATFAKQTLLSLSQAEDFLREHLGICYDTCHFALAYEEPQQAISALEQAGIRILKVQASSALAVRFTPSHHPQIIRQIASFQENTYLHQVRERKLNSPERIQGFDDLPQALASLEPSQIEREWRIHFHVPIFASQLRDLSTTQHHLAKTVALQLRQPFCPHWEVETYTWQVLPHEYQCATLNEALIREIRWLLTKMEESQ